MTPPNGCQLGCQLDSFDESLINIVAQKPAKASLSYNVVSMTGDLLLLSDLICIFLAAAISTVVYSQWLAPLGLAPGVGKDFAQAAMVAAVLGPFILYDKGFGSVASRGQMAVLVRSYALRFTIFAGVVLALATEPKPLS